MNKNIRLTTLFHSFREKLTTDQINGDGIFYPSSKVSSLVVDSNSQNVFMTRSNA